MDSGIIDLYVLTVEIAEAEMCDVMTSVLEAASDRSTNRFRCSLKTFAARLTASSGVRVPFV